MIKVYILDDHPIVMRGMRLILSKETDIELTGEAASYKELKGLLRRGSQRGSPGRPRRSWPSKTGTSTR